MSTQAHALFRKAFGDSPNMMTPYVHSRGIRGRWAWELSEGTGFEHEPIFGVTVIPSDGSERGDEAFELSQMFHSLAEARAYIRGLT